MHNAAILRAIIVMGSISVFARAAAAARDIVLAREYGAGDEVDAFVIALAIPLFAAVVTSGAVPSALVPSFVRLRQRQSREAAAELTANVLLLNLVVAVGAMAVLAAVSSGALRVVGSGFDDEKLNLSRSMLFIMLPVLALTSASTVWAAVLNASDRFALTAAVPALAPLVSIAFLLTWGDDWGVRAVAWGTLTGGLLECALLGAAAVRSGVRLLPRRVQFSGDVRRVGLQYLPIAGGTTLMAGNVLVDQAVAATRGGGTVAALSFGNKATSFVVGTAAFAVSSAVLPYFSAMTGRRAWEQLRSTFRTYAVLVVVASLPVVVALAVASRPIIEVVFEGGQFTDADTRLVARVQTLYALQIPFYILSMMGFRLLSALHENGVLAVLAVVCVVVNIIADFLFLELWGAPGIALATTLVYALAAAVLIIRVEASLRNRCIGMSPADAGVNGSGPR